MRVGHKGAIPPMEWIEQYDHAVYSAVIITLFVLWHWAIYIQKDIIVLTSQTDVFACDVM